MMSNCAFWSASGELLAVHGVGSDDPRTTFGPWAASLRFPPGRLVSLSPSFPPLPANASGWNALPQAPRPAAGRPPRLCDPAAAVATPAPARDEAAARLFPARVTHEKFVLQSWPTWVCSVQLEREEKLEGWYAALDETKANHFLVRLLPHRGRLPGDGWRNMLAWSLKAFAGLRLVPLNGLPRSEVLAAFPAWEYRVEAGQGTDAAAWNVQILPSRRLLSSWAPDISDPWEATALLRWVRPGIVPPPEPPRQGEPTWAELFSRWPAADARLVVQNVLTARPGGAAGSAALFFDTLAVPAGPDGRSLVRFVPQPGLPLALLSTLFGRRAWHEIERAKRRLPPAGELWRLRSEALADLDRRLVEGRLVWSAQAQALWEVFYREPRQRDLSARLASIRRSGRWTEVLAGDPRVPEGLLRGLDVTDAALCLRDAPDTRWRRFVTGRREKELREELEFCRLWEARGELTLERQLEAWRAWDEWIAALPLTDGGREN